MQKLELKTTSEIIGGEPSERRCDRIYRRYERALSRGWDSADRLLDKWRDICN